MNPAQIRRLARRLHEDRSRRIETMLVRLTATGHLDDFGLREPPEVRHVALDDRTFDVPERLSHFKVLNPNYVWCDKHGCIHDNTLNPYGYIEDGKQDYCTPNQHRPVYVQSDDRDEEF